MGGFVGNLFGGNDAPTSPQVNVYQPTGTAQQDQNLQNLFTSNTNYLSGGNNPFTQLNPQFLQAFNQLFNNPAAGGLTTAASNAGNAFTAAGNAAGSNANALSTAALGVLPGASSVMNMGLDPQNALYAQQLQKTNDQANVANAQYGLTGQQAAGNVNQADTNFNIDWQNNQLQRAISALGAGGSAITNAGTSLNNSNNLATSGATSLMAGGSLPYQANNTLGNTQEAALASYINQLLGPVTSSQQTISELQNYLNEGVNASNYGAEQALADYQQQNQDIGSLFSGIGSILGWQPGGSGSTVGSNIWDMLPSMSSLSSLFSSSGGTADAGTAALDAFAMA